MDGRYNHVVQAGPIEPNGGPLTTPGAEKAIEPNGLSTSACALASSLILHTQVKAHEFQELVLML